MTTAGRPPCLGHGEGRAEAAPDGAGLAAEEVELLVDAREERVVVLHDLVQAFAVDRIQVVDAVLVNLGDLLADVLAALQILEQDRG